MATWLSPEILTWQDSKLQKMAQDIAEAQAFHYLPILADALEDAGCESSIVLNHCRKVQGYRGASWVLDTLRQVIPTSVDVGQQLQSQMLFFKKYFGLDLDFFTLDLPRYQAGFDRLIIVPKELCKDARPYDWVFGVCKQYFPCYRYQEQTSLDQLITHNDRHPSQGTYAIWVRDRQEADEENKNLSANQLSERNIQGVTLLERQLHGLKR
jgi:hypothetical protein